MATVLDVGLLGAFDVIFPVIFVFVAIYALLHKTKVISGNIGINAIVAVVIAFMVALSRTLTDVLNVAIPWFVIAIIFFLLIIFIFMVFGAQESSIASVVTKNSFQWVIFVVAIVIILGSFGKVLGEQRGAALDSDLIDEAREKGVASGDFETDVIATFFHPKVLGLIVIFLIAIFAILLLSKGVYGKGLEL